MLSAGDLLQGGALFSGLSGDDRERLASVSLKKTYEKGDLLFREGDQPQFLHTIARGRVKVVKLTPSGREIILEIFGPGDPVGAVVSYEGRPYPASAVALERTVCILVHRTAFFDLLERRPSLVRGFLAGMAQRIAELTQRIPEIVGAKVETRFAHLFLKLARSMGRNTSEGVFIPLQLSRQDLADLAGTTIETAIRVMSRWNRDGVVRTAPEGFLLADQRALEGLISG